MSARLNIDVDDEDNILQLLKDRREREAKTRADRIGLDQHQHQKGRNFKTLRATFAELLRLGFSKEIVQRALSTGTHNTALSADSSVSDISACAAASPRPDKRSGACTTVEAAIEWICLNIPNEQLPPRFATSERCGHARTATAGGLQLLHAADPQREQRQSQEGQQGQEGTAANTVNETGYVQAVTDKKPTLPENEKHALSEQTEAEAEAARKSWILRYMVEEQEREEEEEEEASREADEQRRFALLSPVEQLQNLRDRFEQLRASVKVRKSKSTNNGRSQHEGRNRDSSLQEDQAELRSLSQRIRDLEARGVRVHSQPCEAPKPPATEISSCATVGDDDGMFALFGGDKSGGEDEVTGEGSGALTGMGKERDNPSMDVLDEDDDIGMFGMFDNVEVDDDNSAFDAANTLDTKDEQEQQEQQSPHVKDSQDKKLQVSQPAQVQDATMSWAFDRRGKKGKGGKGRGSKGKKPITTASGLTAGWTGKQPKQVLLDWCKKRKLPQPKFERRGGKASGYRATVTVVADFQNQNSAHPGISGVASTGKSKKKKKKKARETVEFAFDLSELSSFCHAYTEDATSPDAPHKSMAQNATCFDAKGVAASINLRLYSHSHLGTDEDESLSAAGDDGFGFNTLVAAQHAVSVKALYALANAAQLNNMHTLLPPEFKRLWHFWANKQQNDDAKLHQAEESDLNEAVQQLLDADELTQKQLQQQRKNSEEAQGSPQHIGPSTSDQAGHVTEAQQHNTERQGDLRHIRAAQSFSQGISGAGRRMQDEMSRRRRIAQMHKSGSSKANIAFAQLQDSRRALPVSAFRGQILEAIEQHQVTVISGATGCGKTTQVPQYVLEDALQKGEGDRCFIVCTQPRRIAATAVAARVADEIGDTLGKGCDKDDCSIHDRREDTCSEDEADSMLCNDNCHTRKGTDQQHARQRNETRFVGYQIRGEATRTRETRLLFCTTGVMLRRLHSDPQLKGVSHIIIDEVHERDLQSDFLLLVLKRLVQQEHEHQQKWLQCNATDAGHEPPVQSPLRPLRVVLMSATVDADRFAGYFSSVSVGKQLHPVPGLRTQAVDATAHPKQTLQPDWSGFDDWEAAADADAFATNVAPALQQVSAATSTNKLTSATLQIPGRTYPIETYFLADILEYTGHFIGEDDYCARMSKQNERTTMVTVAHGSGANRVRMRREVAWDDNDAVRRAQAAEDRSGRYTEAALRFGVKDNSNAGGTCPSTSSASQVGADEQVGHGRYSRSTLVSLERVDASKINFDLIIELLEALLIERRTLPPPLEPPSEDAICDAGKDKTGEEGAVLIFLPGLKEIRVLIAAIRASHTLSGGNSDDKGSRRRGPWLWPVAVHSALPPKEQQLVFARPPPGGIKVIAATNIAETSLTISDVTTVIDCGRMKVMRWDGLNRTSALIEVWCSRDHAQQRRGRAGRVAPGRCFRLYPQETFDDEMAAHATPEMLRSSLTELCLQIHASNLAQSCQMFLGEALDPPPVASVKDAISTLHEVGALAKSIDSTRESQTEPRSSESCDRDGDGNEGTITPLGRHMARLPLHPRIAKMLILSALVGSSLDQVGVSSANGGEIQSVLEPVLTVAAAVGLRTPFLTPADATEAEVVQAARLALLKTELELAGRDRNAVMAGTVLTFPHSASDFTLLVLAQHEWERVTSSSGRQSAAERTVINRLGLHRDTLREIKRLKVQFRTLLRGIGFLRGDASGQDHASNTNADGSGYAINWSMVNAIVCGGLYPNVARPERDEQHRSIIRYFAQKSGEAARGVSSSRQQQVWIHPSSINAKGNSLAAQSSSAALHWLIFHEKVRTSRLFVRTTMLATPFALLLFGAQTIEVDHISRTVVADQWIVFRCPPKTALVIKALRAQLAQVLQRKLDDPHALIAEEGRALIGAVRKLLVSEAASTADSATATLR